MSIEDGQPYYTDNEEDQFLPYYYLSDSEEQHFSFPQEYLKNVSDCNHIAKIHPKFSNFSSDKTLEDNQFQLKTNNQSTFFNKECEKIQSERFVQQTSPSVKQSHKSINQQIQKDIKHKPIQKKHSKESLLVISVTRKEFEQTRLEKIQRYREKKSKRNWERGILYMERKKLACRRQRVQGRFQGKLTQQPITTHQKINSN